MEKKQIFAVLKKALWIVLTAILIFLIIVVSVLAFDKFVKKSIVPSCFGFSALTVETGSMQGTIDEGDLIIIKKTDDYKIGDIITYLGEGDTIPTTHRIVNYNSDGTFVTKGDANNTTDQDWITQDMILGEVVLVVPKLGIFGDWVRAEGWLYIVSVLAIIVLGSFIIKSSSGEKENAEKDCQAANPNTEKVTEQEQTDDYLKPQSQDSSNEPDNKQS